jgi:hypothetical protein
MQAKRCRLQTLHRKNADGSITPHHGHLFLCEEGYGQANDKSWHVYPPGGDPQRLFANVHRVIEHEDGTCSIEGPPFASVHGAFKLARDVWVLQPVEERAPVPPVVGVPPLGGSAPAPAEAGTPTEPPPAPAA